VASVRRAWPFLPIPLVVVVALALLVAAAVGSVGLTHLSRTSDAQAQLRAKLLSNTLAARLAEAAEDNHPEIARAVARRAEGTEMVVLDDDARVLLDLTHQTPPRERLQDVLARREGEVETSLGRTFFHTEAFGTKSGKREILVAFVRAPSRPDSASTLAVSLVALTFLLIFVAGTASYSVAFDALRDVAFVTKRIRDMTRVATEPAGEPIPARTMDEVGVLTLAFNDLRGRFEAAEQRHRADLTRALEQDKDRAEFLAAVSHELRSPLHAILGFADVLSDEVDGPLSDDAREDVEQIRESGQHLSGLIHDILEFSALEGGQLKLVLAPVDLAQVAAEVVRESLVLVQGRPLTLSLSSDGPVMVRGDAKRLRQIVSNLVGNAIKFTKAGEVRVRVWEEAYEATVSVLDTGPGIRPEERALIFDEYKQSKHERGLRRGTGLGLAIARRLVALHHGKIKLATEVGRGSEFRVVLKSANRPAERSSRESGRP